MDGQGISAERVTEYQVQVGAHVLRLNAVEATLLRDRLAILLRGIASDRIGQIISAVATVFRVSTDDLISRLRPTYLTQPRHAAYWLCRQEGMKLTRIGAAFNDRDHSSITNGIQCCVTLMQQDRKYRGLVEQAAKLAGIPVDSTSTQR